MDRWAPPTGPAPTGPPAAAPIALTAPRGSGGTVTVLSSRTPLRARAGHGWTPQRDAVALVLGTATAALDDVVVRLPGEHPIDGRAPHGELQVRFVAPEGAKVVLAVPLRRGARSAGITALLDDVLDMRALLPAPRRLLAYAGSETIPPFQEPVMWLVSATPLRVHVSQLSRLVQRSHGRPLPPRRVQAGDGRPVVPLQARLLTVHHGAGTGEITRT